MIIDKNCNNLQFLKRISLMNMILERLCVKSAVKILQNLTEDTTAGRVVK